MLLHIVYCCPTARNRYYLFFLGTTPGPIFLGAIIDSSCDVWQDTCGQKGSCWIYRKLELGTRIMAWWIALKILGLIFLLLAAKFYKHPKDKKETNISPPNVLNDTDNLRNTKEFTKL